VAIVDYLLGWAAPSQAINTLDQLADCLEGFLVHFEVNRESLIRTGHPEVHVDHLSWLYFRLAKLYYTSLPDRTQIVRMDDLSRGVFRPLGPTGRPAAWLSEDDREAGRFFAAQMQEVAAFIEDAKAAGRLPWDFSMPSVLIRTPDLLTHRGIDEIAAEDAARLAASRTKFFELKVKVVRRVIKALRDGDPASLWPDCLSALVDALTGEEAEFFLRMDRFYIGFDVRTGETLAGEADLVAGGLTDLLEVVGHCEKELTLGTIDRTVRAIAAIQEAASIRSYYAAVGQPWRSDLDAALDLFVELECREASFWAGFRRRVNDALENEFYEEVVIRIPVRRKLVTKFEPQLRTFAQWQKAHLEATGALPTLILSSSEPPTIGEEHVFRREGEYWTLQYDGRQVRMKHAKGLADLAILLSRPGQPIPAVELEALSSARSPARLVQGITNVSREQLVEQGLHIGGTVDGGTIPDRQALDEYRRQYRDLQAELRDAEDCNDVERASRLREQLEWLRDEVARATGLSGKRRNVDADAERARKRVSGRIEDAIRKVEREHPSLGRHLRNSVETGTTCSYLPEADTAWVL
jgi:hypothetical protein